MSAVKISQTNAVIGLTVAVLAVTLFLQSPPAGDDRGNPEDMYTDEWITSPDPLPLGASLGETSIVGQITSARIPVTVTMWDASKPNPDTWRGLSNVTVIERRVDHVIVVLLDEEYNPIQYPVTWSPRRFYGDLQYLMDSLYVQVRGELFNYTGWDGKLYQTLRLTDVSLYSAVGVKGNAAPVKIRT